MAQPRDSKGRWTKGGGGLAAVLVAVVLGAGVTGTSGLGSSAARSGTPNNAKAKDRSAARVVLRLEQRGLEVQQRQVSAGTDCAARSYGQVQVFFRQQPCTNLFRALFDVRDAQGDTAVVAVAWVDMPDASQAGQFQRLVDESGTGNVAELPANGVRFTGEHYVSTREDVTVVNAQAEPAGRTASAAALAEAITAALR